MSRNVTIRLFINDTDPQEAAALLRERARLKLEKRVYVKPYVRCGPWQWFRPANANATKAVERRAKTAWEIEAEKLRREKAEHEKRVKAVLKEVEAAAREGRPPRV